MSTHSVADAKNRLPQLIDRALKGEDAVITRHGRPVVTLKSGAPAGASDLKGSHRLVESASREAERSAGRRCHPGPQNARRGMAVTVYLDANILVALFTEDALTARADALLRNADDVLIVSDFVSIEFASAIARTVRIGQISAEAARGTFSDFEIWTERATQREQLMSADITTAITFIRRLDLAIRAPDAFNIAIAQRVGADLATFDHQMAAAARALGITLVIG
jgi:prevent-host-death family protein